MELCDRGDARELRISSSYRWTMTTDQKWLKPRQRKGDPGVTFVKIGADENGTGEERTGTMTITFIDLPPDVPQTVAGKSVTIAVTQGKKGDYWNNGEVLWINKHKKGKGVPVMIVGDGFDRQDLKKGGYWETAAAVFAESIKKVMVVKDLYEDYIDLGIYMAESKERGIEAHDYQNCVMKRDTQYRARQFGEYDGSKARRQLEQIPGINKEAIRYCFVANGPFGGWAYLNDNAFASVLQVTDFAWVTHEFVGHAFAGLPDLYMTPFECENVDKTNDPEQVRWSAFLKKDEYVKAGIGIHKCHSDNVYVAEPHGRSLMNNHVGNAYFTALERYQIWKFILSAAGKTDLTPEKFFEFDIPKYVGKHERYPFANPPRPGNVTDWWKDLWKLEK
jgi:hypothetical protein